MKIIFAFVVLLGSLTALDEDLHDDFRAIEKNQFGKTLIDALEIHLQTSEPMSRFLDIMREIESQIEQDQNNSDQSHKDFMIACGRDQSQSETDSNLLSRRNVELQSNSDQLRDEQEKQQLMVDDKTKWLSLLKDKITQVDNNRNDEMLDYQQQIDEKQYIVYVVGGVKRLFYDQDSNFLQISDQTSKDQMQSIVQDLGQAQVHAKQFTKSKSYESFLQVLSHVASLLQVDDQESINKLLEVCEQLYRNADDGMILLRRQEDRRIDLYQKQKLILDKENTQTEADLAQMTSQLLQVVGKIQSVNTDQEDTSKRRELKTKQIDDRGEECKTESYFFKQISEDREKRRQLVSTVIGLFSANQKEFKNYINNGRQ